MNGSLLLAIAVSAVGGDVGWQPLPGGGSEYIIQIRPHLVDRLKEGIDITSDVPANVKNIRSCRITAGLAELPRIDEAPVTTGPEDDLKASDPLDAGVNETPRALPWIDGAEDGVQPAIFQGTQPKSETPRPATEPDGAEPAPPSSWLLATLAISLMGTSTGMLFTGWTAWDYRSRYRRVLEKLPVEERMELNMAADGGGS